MILTKIFSDNDSFVAWQQEALDQGQERLIHQIQPLVMNINASGEEQLSDLTNKSQTDLNVNTYGIFVVYIEN